MGLIHTQAYANFSRSEDSLKEHNIDCLSGHHAQDALRQKPFTFLAVYQEDYWYLFQKIFKFSSGQHSQTESSFS